MTRFALGVHFVDSHPAHMRYFLMPVSLSPGVRGATGGFRAVVG